MHLVEMNFIDIIDLQVEGENGDLRLPYRTRLEAQAREGTSAVISASVAPSGRRHRPRLHSLLLLRRHRTNLLPAARVSGDKGDADVT
jgi:hypothetical protein